MHNQQDKLATSAVPTLILSVILRSKTLNSSNINARSPEGRLEEAIGLAHAIDLNIVHSETIQLNRPSPATLIGKGGVERLKGVISGLEVGLVIVDAALSPIQQRNLERSWKTKVIDRTGLILEIFGARARTREGRLQVELAALSYQKSRLVRSWTHLERQRGGFGFIGGPGESQIEMDRRMISERVIKLNNELETVKRTRELHRKSRREIPYPIVALVGYTNAGKSTLFNLMTQANVVAQDQLFATLDPTMRQVRLPSGREIILSDTVGFISELPTHLIAAFRATLEEVLEAAIILHVRDISHPESKAQAQDVTHVLKELGIEDTAHSPLIEVLNKVDLLSPEALQVQTTIASRKALNEGGGVLLSALKGEGLDNLYDVIDSFIASTQKQYHISLPPTAGAALAWLHDHSEILSRHDTEDAIDLEVRLSKADWGRFQHRYGIPIPKTQD